MTTPSSPVALLDQLDELRAKATPGPWFAWEEHGRDYSDEHWSALGIRSMTGTLPEVAQTHPLWLEENDHARGDAALIVAAVNALGPLTAAVRAVLEKCEQMEREAPKPQVGGFMAEEFRRVVTAALSVTP